jgi:hypothetical protein
MKRASFTSTTCLTLIRESLPPPPPSHTHTQLTHTACPTARRTLDGTRTFVMKCSKSAKSMATSCTLRLTSSPRATCLCDLRRSTQHAPQGLSCTAGVFPLFLSFSFFFSFFVCLMLLFNPLFNWCVVRLFLVHLLQDPQLITVAGPGVKKDKFLTNEHIVCCTRPSMSQVLRRKDDLSRVP